ncbi:hypothetical protein [Butyrivibrio proteoclasticus]|uniref:hypothetical protein n=1 Tax=Butyrivibrio proteoclasticus TaxID=43305 RepID=UPI00047B6878|nr:hypothetical protein [Butyrivibrio proteoclasticus]
MGKVEAEESHIKKHIQYWIDYDGKGERYRRENDLDCILTGGNLFADALISLWSPLKYVLEYENNRCWQEFDPKDRSKNNNKFLEKIKDNVENFIPDEDLRGKLERLFELGRTRANVIILPYRKWNTLRGGNPYYDYMPYFLYDILNVNADEEFAEFGEAVQNWIRREHLEMFFDGNVIKRENIKDLCGIGTVTPRWMNKKESFDIRLLLENYIEILEERSEFYP